MINLPFERLRTSDQREAFEESHSGWLLAPMQSGKTGMITCIIPLMRAVFGGAYDTFRVANDKIDLWSAAVCSPGAQNTERA